MTRKTDRDCELPNLLSFLREKKDTFESLLDVGAHYSAGYYANDVRLYAKKYHGLDPVLDEVVDRIVDKYFVADFLKQPLDFYDFVLCLSTIEHVGMYGVVYSDPFQKRDEFFEKLLKTATRYLWLSFPVGQAYTIPGEMSIIPLEQCERWLELVKNYKVTSGFFHSEGPQAGYPWELSTKEQCYAQKYIDSVGNQSICILEIEK